MKQSRSGLFLMEFIIAILFFSLASVLCIRLFVQSHNLSQSATERTQACMWSENIAELFYACDTPEALVAALEAEEQIDIDYVDRVLTLSFDQDWKLLADTDGTLPVYSLSAVFSTSDQTCFADINVLINADDKQIYHLEISKHIPLTIGDLTD